MLWSIFICCLSANIFGEDDKPKLITEEIFGKKYSFYAKYEMYKDRVALALKNGKVIMLSPEDGSVASITHSHSSYFKVKGVEVSRSKVQYTVDVVKRFWLGEDEFKVVSENATSVGSITFTYQFKKNSVLFQAETLCEVQYAMHPYFMVYVYKLENEGTDYNAFIKKNYKKSITKLDPREGKDVYIMLDDDNTSYSKKVKASQAAGGFKQAAVYYRRGFKTLEITPMNSQNNVGLYVTSNFLGVGNQRFHVASSVSGGGYESFKYKSNDFPRSTRTLRASNKIHLCGGLLSLK